MVPFQSASFTQYQTQAYNTDFLDELRLKDCYS